MRKTLTTVFLICAIIICNYAQIPKPPTAALTPNAASLGIYGAIPVSLYTGTPHISIPIFELDNFHDFSFPISLDYHAAGIQIDQHPGWVGLGWNLNVGGAITRQINGSPDDLNWPIKIGSINNTLTGYYFDYQLLNEDRWNQKSYLEEVTMLPFESYDEIDTQPDEFSFSFNGYSGKFYLNHSGQWQVQCNKPVKVEFDGTFYEVPNKLSTIGSIKYTEYGNSKYFSGFTITTEDGIKYIFGKDQNSTEFSIDFYRQHENSWFATAWYLTKTILTNGTEINLTYERKEYINQMYISVNDNIKTEISMSGNSTNVSCSGSTSGSVYNYSGKLLSPVYLKKIKSDNLEINFHISQTTELSYELSAYSHSKEYIEYGIDGLVCLAAGEINPTLSMCIDSLKWYKLDKITVEGNEEAFIDMKLTYSESTEQRLTLEKVTFETGHLDEQKFYSFDYYKISELPKYLTSLSDHWGYYNGSSINFNEIITFQNLSILL